MIKKLDRTLRHERGSGFIISEPVSIGEMQEKVNELVDAVNELQATISKMENIECSENVQPVAESRSENVQDKFSQYRDWAGKLCRFWNIKKDDAIYDILEEVIADWSYQFKTKRDYIFDHCEPVKPDDNIIYKGDNNE